MEGISYTLGSKEQMTNLRSILNFTDWSKKKYVIMATLGASVLSVLGVLDSRGLGLENTILFPILQVKYILVGLALISLYWMWEGFV